MKVKILQKLIQINIEKNNIKLYNITKLQMKEGKKWKN